MRIVIDTDGRTLTIQGRDGGPAEHPLYGPEALELVSRLWVKMGWVSRYSYDFKWLGRSVIQLPEDIVRLQELIWTTKPSVIVETGIAHGGSTVFFAGMMELLGRGKVVSVDIEIRPHNRAAIEVHPLFRRITMIERSSTDAATIEEVKAELGPEDRVMVFLDSNHTKAHVARELELYAPLVSPGCYLVVADGVTSILADVPGGKPEWAADNPMQAAKEFLARHSDFELDVSYTRTGVTYFQGGYLKCVKD